MYFQLLSFPRSENVMFPSFQFREFQTPKFGYVHENTGDQKHSLAHNYFVFHIFIFSLFRDLLNISRYENTMGNKYKAESSLKKYYVQKYI